MSDDDAIRRVLAMLPRPLIERFAAIAIDLMDEMDAASEDLGPEPIEDEEGGVESRDADPVEMLVSHRRYLECEIHKVWRAPLRLVGDGIG